MAPAAPAESKPAVKSSRPGTPDEARVALAEPFPPHLIVWRPENLNTPAGDVALIPDVDVRAVEERLDVVFGPENWETVYDVHDGQTECVLRVRFPPTSSGSTQWVQRCAVGYPELVAVPGDVRTATTSLHEDALKRAALSLGVGRYLWRVPAQVGQWDTKRVTVPPKMPERFLPVDYRKAGPKLADQASKLALSYCTSAKMDVSKYTAQLLKELGQKETVALADLQTRHVRRFMQWVNEDITRLNAEKPVSAA